MESNSKMALAGMEESLHSALATLHQLHCSVSSFTLPSQLLVLERLNELVKDLNLMQSSSNQCNLEIPVEVIRFIDEGKNPDEFTKDLLNHCIQRNQATKGKALRKHILEEVEEAFPEETETYRMLRTASALESRRSAAQPIPGLSNGDARVKPEHTG
ncbi:hypothetical protein SELMODRAFT_235078 [Selaginella moellendorffii]|uniref:Mediator of RNA polymerase II transcription subunit 10 n=1 Tax=Selaginella moellendorffii TaxID=88036 RepID=D8STJ1_SELML|nr:hypothetical protein SELMODRAFT_235078 [Selaginella moellendorffii]